MHTTVPYANGIINLTIENRAVDWTYENAEKLTSLHTTPYDLPINGKFDKKFKEIKVDVAGLDTANDLNLGDILVPANMTPKHKLNGEEVTGVELAVDAVAMIEANIASVEVEGYAFAKGDGKENVYEFCNTYANDKTQTDINVLFTLTLGAIPGDVTVDLGNYEFDYVKDYRPGYNFVHYYGRTADNKADNATDPLYLAFGEMTAKEQGAFKDDAQYVGLLEVVKNAPYSFEKNTLPVTNLSGYQFLMPNGSNLRSLQIPRNAVSAFSDEFAAQTAKNLWFGQKVTFKGTASFKAPSYGLSLHPDLVKNGIATLNGKEVDGKYQIVTDDLSKYFNVTNCDDNALNGRLEVRYERVTDKTAEEGYDNYPTIPAKADVETKEGVLSNASISWADYTARDLEVKASLYYDNIALGVSENLTLTIKDPIVKFEAPKIEVARKPFDEIQVKLWRAMDIRGIIEYKEGNKVVSIVNPDAADRHEMWKPNANIYGAEVEFVDAQVFVGKDEVEFEALPHKLEINLEKGIVWYHADSADLQEPITVRVTAKLTHVYNYNGKVAEAEADHLTKTFDVVIAQ